MGDSNIIAIDFGTAYSGYAYTVKDKEKQTDPILKKWGKEFGHETPKTPTCLLFNEDEEFLKFGYEAKIAYMNMHGEQAKKHFYFENFKMDLYDAKLDRDARINAANGEKMTALKVFTESLKYLKEDALRTISTTTKRELLPSDFTWVLTVPAIWDSSAKQFMREAAIQAEIVTKETQHKLIIALEPEAASVWCKKLPADGFITQNYNEEGLDQSSGTQYMLVDCGGGTIDITVHEVLDGGALKELHKASGNDLGGQTVDRKFKEFLREIFSGCVWDEYEENYPSEVLKMMNNFMYLKQVDEDVQMVCPYNLGTLAQKKQEIEKFFESVQGASWDDGSIKISKERLRSFFAESLKGITDSVRRILNKDLSIEYILLVGGYAESLILRQHVIDQFGDQCKVLCPFRPQEAIVKGALTFGRNPGLIEYRKSVYTYGVSVAERFDESKHKKENKFSTNDGDYCKGIFMKLVEEGEDVRWNEMRNYILYPIERDQTKVKFDFYQTERKTLQYVNDWGVEKSGSFYVEMPDTSGGRTRKVELNIKFGSTEITAIGTDMTSHSQGSVKFDFLTNP